MLPVPALASVGGSHVGGAPFGVVTGFHQRVLVDPTTVLQLELPRKMFFFFHRPFFILFYDRDDDMCTCIDMLMRCVPSFVLLPG